MREQRIGLEEAKETQAFVLEYLKWDMSKKERKSSGWWLEGLPVEEKRGSKSSLIESRFKKKTLAKASLKKEIEKGFCLKRGRNESSKFYTIFDF